MKHPTIKNRFFLVIGRDVEITVRCLLSWGQIVWDPTAMMALLTITGSAPMTGMCEGNGLVGNFYFYVFAICCSVMTHDVFWIGGGID